MTATAMRDVDTPRGLNHKPRRGRCAWGRVRHLRLIHGRKLHDRLRNTRLEARVHFRSQAERQQHRWRSVNEMTVAAFDICDRRNSWAIIRVETPHSCTLVRTLTNLIASH